MLDAFVSIFTAEMILFCFLGAFIGTLGGVLPGIGPTGTMALLLPLLFTLQPLHALVVMAGIMYGSQFGNSISAILLNIPGDPGALATMIEGNILARSNRAGQALLVAALSSFFGAVAGTILLAFCVQLIVPFALAFGPAEYFALGVFALCMVSALSSESVLKSLAMTFFGFFLAIPGADIITGSWRFTFDFPYLYGGVGLVPLAMGLFAITEVIFVIKRRGDGHGLAKIGGFWPGRKPMLHTVSSMTRGTGIGFLIGVLPGVGAVPAVFASYGIEKRVAKRRHLFGKGAVEGIAGPEAANNAAYAGAFAPLFTLGIPGSGPHALILGALIVLGIRPGPMFLSTQQESFFLPFIAAMVLASVILLILNLPMLPLWVSVLRVPLPVLMSIIMVITVAGVFTLQYSFFDVWMMLAFGVVGYWLRRAGFPLAPLLLAFVLGRLIEQSFRQALVIDGGTFEFLAQPIVAVLLALSVLFLFVPTMLKVIATRRSQRTEPTEAVPATGSSEEFR